MRILHYLIGLPPLRNGGAPLYAKDLIEAEYLKGNDLSVLYPGNTLCISNKTKLRKQKQYNGIKCYSIQNPVLSPLMYGVKDPTIITEYNKKLLHKELEIFWKEIKPDIFHIHTFMGLSPQIIKFLKSKGTKIVMTSHDYFGLCPKVNLIDRYGQVCENPNGLVCEDCNVFAKNKYYLKFINSFFFLKYKNKLPKKIRKTAYRIPTKSCNGKLTENSQSPYIKLYNYYMDLFHLIDGMHFNSNVSSSVYSQFIDFHHSEIIPITTKSISDKRCLKAFSDKVRITFIAGLGPAKGFPLLKKTLMDLFFKGIDNWRLSVWGVNLFGEDSDCKNIKYRGKFTSDQLTDIYKHTDLLVVPSKWKETFSLVALEALSFGVPVLMSDNVGAQVLIKDITPELIFHEEKELENKLKDILLLPSVLLDYNKKICDSKSINFSLEKHADEILNFYKRVMKI